MNKVIQMLVDLEQDLRAKKQYSAADNLLPIIEEVMKRDWTPCSDHNPEESGEYLVAHANGHYQVVTYSARYDAWNAYDDCYDPVCEMRSVVAWRPLREDFIPPEPEVICNEN